jgi:hypothetical protein
MFVRIIENGHKFITPANNFNSESVIYPEFRGINA